MDVTPREENAVPKTAWLYLATVPVFFGIDFVWLTFVANGFYRAKLLLEKFDMRAGLAFYLLYIVGILVFAVLPGVEKQSVVEALWRGALFGLIAYATYDLTNLATLKNWSPAVAFVDMAWGAVLTGTVASASWWIAGRLGV
jgi:uncharacterized membrane protein